MSRKEFQRVKVIENAAGRRLSVREAARLLPRGQFNQGRPGALSTKALRTSPIKQNRTGEIRFSRFLVVLRFGAVNALRSGHPVFSGARHFPRRLRLDYFSGCR